MTALLACIGAMLVPGILQQPTVTLSQSPTGLHVVWTAPAGPKISHWIGVVLTTRADTATDVPSAWYKYLLSEEPQGTMDFGIPPGGTYEARYYGGNSGPILARSPALPVAGPVVPVPDPMPPGSAPIGEPILYFEITYADGSKVEGPTSDTFENLMFRYRSSALFLGSSVLRVWKLAIPKPTTPADIELSGLVRSEIP